MKIEKMTLSQMKEANGEILEKINNFIQKQDNAGVVFTWLQTLIDTLDDLSADDFFGTEGWEDFFNIN